MRLPFQEAFLDAEWGCVYGRATLPTRLIGMNLCDVWLDEGGMLHVGFGDRVQADLLRHREVGWRGRRRPPR